MNNFIDSQGYIHAQSNVFNAENAIEFTIIKGALSNENIFIQVYDYLYVSSRDNAHTKYKLSHDNLTACYCYLVLTNISLGDLYILRQKRRQLNSYHPREWAFYNLIEGEGFKPLNYFLISIIMIIGCARKYKHRTYGNGQEVRLIATDSKILAWLRFKSGIDMPITKKICNWLIKKHFGNWKEVFKIYFTDGHPILKHDVKEFEL